MTSTRRDFLRATLISAAGLVVGCKGDDGSAETGETGGTSGDGDGDGDGDPTGDGDGDTGPLTVVEGFELFPQSVASGDPRPGSVILWTRVEDPALADEDLELRLLVGPDASLEFLDDAAPKVVARAAHDHCVKVRLTDLEPGAELYYRFVYVKDGVAHGSRVARTKSAPTPETDAAVRFAVLSCQDYARWFNVLHLLAEDEPELDFVVHLGDYIYETVGDPDFQDPIEGRTLSFDDVEGAIVFNEGEDSEYYAAASLDNYRQLYKAYRADRGLQKVHERAPMIATWDDHEFTNDCHGATGTYFAGTVDETDVERRKRANQAWFEYMPVDYVGEPEFEYDPSAAFPGDLVIYRDFEYGQHLHLLMTDERTWRSDHPIREDAFPATIVVDEATVLAEVGELPPWARPYLDIEAWDGGALADALIAAAGEVGYDPAWITGDLDALVVNDLIETIDPDGMTLTPLSQDELDALPRGVSFASMGKTAFYATFGARQLAIKPPYDLWTRLRYAEDPELEQVLGQAQQDWLLERIGSSTRTWKIWGNEFILGQVAIDVRNSAPPPFDQLYYLSLDLWDGHRNRRDEILASLATFDNVVAVTGDIHGFYATTPFANGDIDQRIAEFVTSSVTSSSFKEILAVAVATNPALASFPQAALLVEALDTLLTSSTAATNPHMAYAQSDLHGYVLVELDGQRCDATYNQVPRAQLFEDKSGNIGAVAGSVSTERFRVNAGERELYRDINGQWARWDHGSQTWML